MNPQFTKEFEVQERNNKPYRTFITDLRKTLTSTFTHNVPALVLYEDVPTKFFDLALREIKGSSVRFRFRMDNLYLIGYQMANGQWLEFNNNARKHLITEQRIAFLDFDGSYKELVNASDVKNTSEITVGSPALTTAIRTLATSENKEVRARSLMTVIVMFPEAIRFIQVLDFIAQNYVRGAQIRDSGNLNLLKQMHCWGQFSKAMFLSDKCPEKGPELVGQWNILQIMEMVGIALRKPSRKGRAITTLQDEDRGDGECYDGLALLEVFSVSLFDRNVQIYGKIEIIDALRTQPIYNRSRENPDYVNARSFDVLLTGPSEAISALGDFTIKFLLYDKAKNDGVLISEEINWNFYDFGNVYDRLISKQLSMGMGSLTINYAVFRNAVAAKLKLQKLRGGKSESKVYGKVSSSIGYDGGETNILLFHRESANSVMIRYGDIILFSRFVVVVPLSSSTFKVTVKLFDSNVLSGREVVDTTFTFQPKISGSDVKPIREDYFEGSMSVDWIRAF